MKIATGQATEEYVDGRPWTDEQVMAMEIAKPKKKGKKGKKRAKK